MASPKLKDRILSYQDASDFKLLGKLPIIISVNGRAFSKATELLDKPYCYKLSECLLSTTLRLCSEVEGTLFAYQHNDEITLVVRNDQNIETVPWFSNNIQKICSITASIATLHFNKCANAIDLNMIGDPCFTSSVFAVPNISEATNTIIYKQQQNFHSAVQLACFYELLQKFDKTVINNMLQGLSIDEKIDLLNQECGIDFNEYPLPFRRGAACYKIPSVIDGVMKNKWTANLELPIFTKDTSFLGNLFRMGTDIFRKEGL